jgi:hypothetical protein
MQPLTCARRHSVDSVDPFPLTPCPSSLTLPPPFPFLNPRSWPLLSLCLLAILLMCWDLDSNFDKNKSCTCNPISDKGRRGRSWKGGFWSLVHYPFVCCPSIARLTILVKTLTVFLVKIICFEVLFDGCLARLNCLWIVAALVHWYC